MLPFIDKIRFVKVKHQTHNSLEVCKDKQEFGNKNQKGRTICSQRQIIHVFDTHFSSNVLQMTFPMFASFCLTMPQISYRFDLVPKMDNRLEIGSI